MRDPAKASGTEVSVIAPGAGLEKLAGGFGFAEGPTCDAECNLFFTDQPNDRILKWDVEGGLSTFLHPAGRANGMCFDPRGHLIACADEKNELWSIAPDGKVTVLVDEHGGKLLSLRLEFPAAGRFALQRQTQTIERRHKPRDFIPGGQRAQRAKALRILRQRFHARHQPLDAHAKPSPDHPRG